MSGMNVVTLMGRVGQDAKVHVFESGKGVMEFSIATSSQYKDKSGEYVEKTTWHNCKKFGNVEKLAGFITKGMMLGVSGSYEEETWEKDGETKRKLVVNVRDVTFTGKPGGGQSQAPSSGGGYGDDDIPF